MGTRTAYIENAEPDWYKQILKQRADQRRTVFLLYFNIRDVVFDAGFPPAHPDELLTLEQFLAHVIGGRELVLGYSLHGGIEWIKVVGQTLSAPPLQRDTSFRQSGEQLWQTVADTVANTPYRIPRPPGAANDDPPEPHHWRQPGRAVRLLTRLLTQRHLVRFPGVQGEQPADKPLSVGLIIDYLHHLAPAPNQAAPHAVPEVVEALQRLSTDPMLNEHKHIVLMLAPDLPSVHPELQGSDSRIERIRVPRPDFKQRQAFLQWLFSVPGFTELPQGELVGRLARQTAGMNYVELRDLVRNAGEVKGGDEAQGDDKAKRQIAELDTVLKERRAEIVQRESGGVLVPMSSDYALDDVAGYGYARRAIRRLVSGILKGGVDLSGVLFTGPPGTGKSFFARALANEAGVNVVTMRNLRNMYVGQSERNLEQALEVARSLEPVVIFVDEIDQAFPNRQSRQMDGGVDQRLLGRLLEFMDDKANLGKVIWVAASNRPDLLDDALISRFRMRIPFLLPDMHACREMLREKLPNQLNKEQKDQAFRWQPASWTPETEQLIADEVVGKFSGRELENVVRTAFWCAQLDKDESQTNAEQWQRRLVEAVDMPWDEPPPQTPVEHRDGEPPLVHAYYLRHAIREASVGHNVDEYTRQSLLALQNTAQHDDELVSAIKEVLPSLAPGILDGNRIDKVGIARELRTIAQRTGRGG